MSTRYREHPVSTPLKPYVDCYWTSSVRSASVASHRVLPDGCIDFLFDLEADRDDGGRLVGAMTRPLLYRPSRAVELVAVRFRPGGAAAFLGVAVDGFTDLQEDLSSEWRRHRLVGKMRDAPCTAARVRVLESVLLRQLGDIPALDRRVARAVDLLGEGACDVTSVADQVGVSRQHLTRLFRRHVGLGPKVFARVSRLQRLIQLTSVEQEASWAAVALASGYCDQSHMIAECRELAGVSPAELANR